MLKSYDYAMTDKDYDDLAEIIVKDGNELAFIAGYEKNIRKMVKALKNENENFIIQKKRLSIKESL